MKRWAIAGFVVFLAVLCIVLHRSTDSGMLLDSDTREILRVIRIPHDPLRWFTGDWPLANGFYRPLSTLAFEIDNRFYGDQAAGYGLTNALLCAACVALLFWFARELTDRPLLAFGAAALFTYWVCGSSLSLGEYITWVAYATLAVGFWRHRLRWQAFVPAALVLLFIAGEVHGIQPLNGRVMNWLPGRTASVMTVFALISLAAYARFERLRLPIPEREPSTPLSKPATRSTSATGRVVRNQPFWAILSALSCAAALASYEQSVMVPAAVLAVAVYFRMRGGRPIWAWQAAFWGILVGYLALRHQIIPPVTSRYQKQQLRYGGGVWLDLSEYIFPPYAFWPTLAVLESPLALLTSGPIAAAMSLITSLATAWWSGLGWSRSEGKLVLTTWGLSIIAFLPMAWLKLFEHYHFWPMAMRAMFLVAVGALAAKLVVIAWSPPAQQAPPRSDPAPGSLLRP